MARKKLMLIVNPVAGHKLGESFSKQAVRLFNDGGFDCKIFMTQKCGDGTDLVIEHCDNFDTVVCMGGDGTLNEVINGLLSCNSDKPLGYIPAGSTNDFATSMNLSLIPENAVQDIIHGKTIKIDAGKFDDKYFSYVASFGAFTKTSYATPQNMKNILGKFSYFIEGAKDIGEIRAEHKIIQADGQTFEGDYIFGAISNSTSIGGLVKYDSDMVSFSDGKLEMLLIKKPDNPANLCSVLHCLNHKNYNNPFIEFYRAGKFLISSQQDTDWSLDGEHARANQELIISCSHQKINFICPQGQ